MLEVFKALSWILLSVVLALHLVRGLHESKRGRVGASMVLTAGAAVLAVDAALLWQGVLASGSNSGIWIVRTLTLILCAPLVVAGTRKYPEWGLEVFVSRQVVFLAATILGVGVYVAVMAAIG